MDFVSVHCLSDERTCRGIRDLLSECDEDFVPPLSTRSGTCDSDLSGSDGGSLDAYMRGVARQDCVVAFEGGRVVGLLSYREDYRPDAAEFRPGERVLYVSTVLVAPEFRRSGACRRMYGALISRLGRTGGFVLTRTWSGNESHARLLESLGFGVLRTIEDDRGEGVHTVYYGARFPAARSCGVCGEEFVSPEEEPSDCYGARAACESVKHVCPSCAVHGRGIDVEKLVLAEWRRLAGIRVEGEPGGEAGPRRASERSDAAPTPVSARGGRRPRKRRDASAKSAPSEAPDGGRPAPSSVEVSTPLDAGPSSAPESRAFGIGDRDGVTMESGFSGSRLVSEADARNALKSDPLGSSISSAVASSRSRKTDEERADAAARAAAEAEKRKESPRGPSGYAAEKRRIHSALSAYREERGLGSFKSLAERAGVTEYLVREIHNAGSVPIDVWRKVGRALGVGAGDD